MKKKNQKEITNPRKIMEESLQTESKNILETKSISEEPPYTFPSTIQIWCLACEQNWIVSKKNDKGEFIEQQICPHSILKSVKR